MKVTAISGSPRKKGDCFNVIEMIQRSFNRVGETQIEYIYRTIGVCGVTLKTDEAYKEEVQNNINHLVDGLFENKETPPTLYQLAMFRAMQSKAFGSAKKKDLSFEYWKERGWFEKEYYTNVKINLFKKIYSRFIRKIMKKLISSKIMIIR